MFEHFIHSWAANADYIISPVQWVLFAAFLPTVLHKEQKPPFSSCIMTGTCLLIMGLTFATLELWNSALSALAVAALWLVVAVQRYRLSKLHGEPLVNMPPWLIRILMRVPYIG